jgi:hypothetical protein
MARLRRPETPTGNLVPDALRDHQHPLWTDPAAFLALCRATGLRPSSSLFPNLVTAPWWARFEAYQFAWCESHGLLNQEGTIDHVQARVAGVDDRSLTRYRLVALRADAGSPRSGR